MKSKILKYSVAALAVIAVIIVAVLFVNKPKKGSGMAGTLDSEHLSSSDNSYVAGPSATNSIKAAQGMPVYGNWKNFTSKDGLPADRVYSVKIDGDRVLAGTHHGLAVYENDKWTTYTTEDGLPHNGVVSIDISPVTGDVWIGTLGGLSRWSAGKFETFNQMNSGMPNDLVYNVVCDGKDVWMATGGGAGHYDTYTKEWEIFTEMNAPMHEPWTYALSAGDGKIFIAAWGGGIIEYNKETKHFRDYTDPDGFMEIDLLPDDGPVHDITTATAWANGILWISSYFGMSRYDGKNWKGYFDHDSGLASNFMNFIKVNGRVAYACTDKGLSTFDGNTWVTYKKNENNNDGVAIITSGSEKKEIKQSPSLAHSFIINAEAKGDVIWVCTSKGLSRGEVIN
jgi:ligand-binding sensor domain-containing protein